MKTTTQPQLEGRQKKCIKIPLKILLLAIIFFAFNNSVHSQGLVQANGPDIAYTTRKFAVKMNNPVLPFEVNGSGKFYKHLFVDSTINSWRVITQEIQTVTAKITGNAQIGGTLIIGSKLTVDGANSRISSTSGGIDFDANNLTTTGNISAGNVQVSGGINTISLLVTGSSLFGGNANFNGNLHAFKISADTLLVSGPSVLNSLFLTDGVRIQPFASAANGGIVRYNSFGTLKALDFPPDTDAVLTGGGYIQKPRQHGNALYGVAVVQRNRTIKFSAHSGGAKRPCCWRQGKHRRHPA